MTITMRYSGSPDHLWTVGEWTPHGDWTPFSDHETQAEAREQIHYLNGGELALSQNMTDALANWVEVLRTRNAELVSLLDIALSLGCDAAWYDRARTAISRSEEVPA